jgi:hypothetical protein
METPARELSSINFESLLGGPLNAVVNAQAKAAMSSVAFIKAVGFKPADSKDPQAPVTGDPIYVSFKYPKEVLPFQPSVPATYTVAVTSGGTGYTSAPDVAITGGGLTGATATSRINGQGVVTSIEITNAGGVPTSAPNVTFSGGGGNGAAATAQFQAAKAAQPAQFQDMKLEVPILTMLPIPFIRIEETTIDFNVKINSVEEAKTDDTFKIDASLDATVKYPPLFSIATVNLKVSTSYQKNTSSGSKVDRTYSMAVHIRAVQDEMPAGMEKLLGILEDAIKSKPTGTPYAGKLDT